MASVAVGHGVATISFPDGTTFKHDIEAGFDVSDAIHTFIDRIKVEGEHASVMGLFGYTSFNAVRYFENIAIKDETQVKNDAPDLLYIMYKVVIAFDQTRRMVTAPGCPVFLSW